MHLHYPGGVLTCTQAQAFIEVVPLARDPVRAVQVTQKSAADSSAGPLHATAHTKQSANCINSPLQVTAHTKKQYGFGLTSLLMWLLTGNIHVMELDWSEDAALAALASDGEGFDVVLAADVGYTTLLHEVSVAVGSAAGLMLECRRGFMSFPQR